MPLISQSSFRPPVLLNNGHLQTIAPTLMKRALQAHYQRERISTPDGDFLDLDWSRAGAGRVAILSHGLEGSSDRWYMRGMAAALNRAGWDVIAWNYRGCSGESNRTLRFYHSGATEDLDIVVSHALAGGYETIALVGFSLGGNITLKYLGERGSGLHPAVAAGVAFSVPCDLRSSAYKLALRSNRIYMNRFLITLREKVRQKMELLPGQIDDRGLEGVKSFLEFDDRYTAPIHGFRDAEDYWARSSSRPFLGAITVPALLVNAADDPFLAGPCYPLEEAKASDRFFLEIPSSGGHVGFIDAHAASRFWMERRAVEFLEEVLPAG